MSLLGAMAGVVRRRTADGVTYLTDWSTDLTIARTGELANQDPRSGWVFLDSGAAAWVGTDELPVFADGAVPIFGTHTNRDADSRDFSTWTTSNASVTTDQVDGPDGSTTEADLLEATSASSPRISKATGEDSDLGFSVWVRHPTYTGDVTLVLGAFTATFTVTDTWQRVEVGAETGTGLTAEIQLDDDASAAVYLWGALVVTGVEQPRLDVRTSGATATQLYTRASMTIDSTLAAAMLSDDGFRFRVWPTHSSSLHRLNNARLLNVASSHLDIYMPSISGDRLTLSTLGGTVEVAAAWSAGDELLITVEMPSVGDYAITCENITQSTTVSGAYTPSQATTLDGRTLTLGNYTAGGGVWGFDGVVGRLEAVP